MRLSHTVSVTVAALSLAAGIAIPASPIAQAAVHPQVVSVWNCNPTYTGGTNAEGYNCYGSGSGTGWLYNSSTGQLVTRCTSFVATLSNPKGMAARYAVYGSGCTGVE